MLYGLPVYRVGMEHQPGFTGTVIVLAKKAGYADCLAR